MTEFTLQLTGEIERKLRAYAKLQGQDVGTIALDILEKGLQEPGPIADPNALPYEEWSQRFGDMLKDLPRVDVVVDDSRDAIYQGRGE